MSSAKGLADQGYSPFELGTGRVDVAAAVTDTVHATGSLFFGNYIWPHDPSDPPVTHDLTFTNDGDQRRHARPHHERDGRCVHSRCVHGHRAGRRQGHGARDR